MINTVVVSIFIYGMQVKTMVNTGNLGIPMNIQIYIFMCNQLFPNSATFIINTRVTGRK